MKKIAVFLSIVCSLLIVSLTLFSKTVQAETSKKVDVITEIKIQNSKGEELATGLGRYDTFRLNAKFALEGKMLKQGIQLKSLSMDQSISSLRILKSTIQSLVKRLPMQKLMQKLVRLS